MPEFEIEPLKGQPERYYNNIESNLKERVGKALENIKKSPRKHLTKRVGIKHLEKGKYCCFWESREVWALRIVYTIIKEPTAGEEGRIRILHILPHLDRKH